MGSLVMEPEDVAAFVANSKWLIFENFTTICIPLNNMHARGSALESNPLGFAFPLLLAQCSLASAATIFASLALRPLRQSIFAAQMLGTILVGSSGLGRISSLATEIFPLRGFVMLDVLSSIGFMLYFFLVGLELDPLTLKKITRRTVVTGIITPMVSFGLTEIFAFLVVQVVDMGPGLAKSMLIVAQAESALAIPTVAYVLAELNIINSELGRMALRSSMVSGLFSFSVTLSMILAGQSIHDKNIMITTIVAGLIFTTIIAFALRPMVFCMMKRVPARASMTRGHFVALILMVLLTGFFSHAVGLHIYYGPFVLGIIMPPPVGSALKERLSSVTNWILLPFFFLKNGLVINVFQIKLKYYVVFQSIALVAAIGKFLGAFLTFLCYKMPIVDAVVLGLLMTVQGLLELGLFKMMKKNSVLDNEAFEVLCISMLIITGLVTPIIKRLYDPSRRYSVYKRRTVTNANPDSELRLLLCLHEEDNIPTALNLLDALNPTFASPLSVFILHLIELVGLEKPVLIPYKTVEDPCSYSGPSEAIFKVFKYYEQSNVGLISVSAYTGVSPCAKMHDDACALAIDERTSLIIVPYHRKFYRNSTQRSRHKAAMVMNKNLLDKAPCTVGILVDRGLVKSSQPALHLGSWSPYRVGVVFLGGDDDREVLAIGEQMADHPNIKLTVIRLLVSGNVAGNGTDATRLDKESLSGFRQSMAGNSRVTYMEEVVMDWSGTTAVICSMERNYELILVGRTHDRQSPLLSGFQEQRENAELGAIGQILALADSRDKATVLVVQQHNRASNDVNMSHNPKHSIGVTNSKKHNHDGLPIQRKSLTKGDEMSESLTIGTSFEEDESDTDSSSDITCIIRGEVSRSRLTCPTARGTSEESAKNFSNMRWVYEPVTPQSNWQSDSEAVVKRPAQSIDLFEIQNNCMKATSPYNSREYV